MYVEYEQILKNRISSSVFVLIMIFVLAVIFVMANIKIFPKDLGLKGKIFVNLFIGIIIVCSVVYFAVLINNLQDDIKNESYVTYNGEFEISKYQERYVTFIDDKGNKITLSGKAEYTGGVYNGTVVYSKKSKCLLEWKIQDTN